MSIKEKFQNMNIGLQILCVLIPVAVVIGGGAYIGLHAYESHVAESASNAVLSTNKDAYKTAKFQLENRILSDEDRTTSLEALTSYKDKILKETLTDDEQDAFNKLVESIQSDYAADAKVLPDTYDGFATKFPADENGYYSEEFKTTLTGLTDEYNKLVKDGKYQEAYNKLTEIGATYTAYVEQQGETVEEADDSATNGTGKTSGTKNPGGSKSGTIGSNSGSESTSSSSENASTSFFINGIEYPAEAQRYQVGIQRGLAPTVTATGDGRGFSLYYTPSTKAQAYAIADSQFKDWCAARGEDYNNNEMSTGTEEDLSGGNGFAYRISVIYSPPGTVTI